MIKLRSQTKRNVYAIASQQVMNKDEHMDRYKVYIVVMGMNMSIFRVASAKGQVASGKTTFKTTIITIK